VNGRLTQDQAGQMREQLKSTADSIAATIQATEERTRELAVALADQTNFVFVGDGPNFATALFSAAKVIEAAGRHAMGQDTEEWAHLQYFVNVDPETPTFIISPGGRGHGRAEELVEVMRRIGRTVIAVVPQGDQQIGT
jgi:glucosamine--fructose-6-phosphate aminotransferase (isomerizing)